MFVRFVTSWKWQGEVIQLINLHNGQSGGVFLQQELLGYIKARECSNTWCEWKEETRA